MASLNFLNQLSWFPHQSFGAGDFLSGGHSRSWATEGEKGKELSRRKTLESTRYPRSLDSCINHFFSLAWGLKLTPLGVNTDLLMGHLLILCDSLLPQPKRNFSLLPFQLLVQNGIPSLAHYLLSGHFQHHYLCIAQRQDYSGFLLGICSISAAQSEAHTETAKRAVSNMHGLDWGILRYTIIIISASWKSFLGIWSLLKVNVKVTYCLC